MGHVSVGGGTAPALPQQGVRDFPASPASGCPSCQCCWGHCLLLGCPPRYSDLSSTAEHSLRTDNATLQSNMTAGILAAI